MITCCIVGLIYWMAVSLAMRYMLKLLLMYKGFMFESRGKSVSLKTKIWAVLVKCK
jgi:carnitine O-palmitoyltransferase 1, liver isoform